MEEPQIRYLDGRRLKRALIAGARRVIEFREQLNSINVFPVADSDTGTNMAGTLRAVLHAILPLSDRSIAVVTRTAADSALSGARGNSGAILAQFFHGIAQELHDVGSVNVRSFGVAVRNAVNYAYDAISEPVEGTILTVLRRWAERFQHACRKTVDFTHALRESIAEARSSLSDTRNGLPSLEKAGVVDAGALGFVHLVEGILHFVTRGRIKEVEETEQLEPVREEPQVVAASGEITHRYCTECIIEGEQIDQPALRSRLSSLGDSLIVAGSSKRARVHVHTDSPWEVFGAAGEHGHVSDQKADDMRKQFAAAHARTQKTAIVVDTACDVPNELLLKDYVHIVPLLVTFGDRFYLDKVGLRPSQFHELVRSHADTFPKTSQPPPRDYERVFSFLLQHYESVVSISVSGGLSGTLQAARTAAARLDDERRRKNGSRTELRETVPPEAGERRGGNSATGTSRPGRLWTVDSRNVSVATGLIVRSVMEAVERGASGEEAARLADDLALRTRILITVPNIDALVRSGRVSRLKGMLAGTFDLKPIITLTDAGTAELAGTARGVEAAERKIMRMLESALPADQPVDFAIAHVDNPEAAHRFEHDIRRAFTPGHEVFVEDATPVLAAHTGAGTVAVAYIEPRT